MKTLLIILTILIVVAGCGESEISNPKRTDAIIYNTNKHHIGRGLYEHTVMYVYSVDNVKYYGEFISKDWTKQLTTNFEIANLLTIEYNSENPKECNFVKKEGNYNCGSNVIKLKAK